MAAAWKWTPLADVIDIDRLSGWAASLRGNPARHFYVLGAYVIGSLLLVPITAIILVTAIIFGPILGSLYSIVGCLAGAVATYAIGRLLGQDFVRKIAGTKWRRLEKKIEQTGIVAVATLRLLPIAPFTVVNIVSGAFKVRCETTFRDRCWDWRRGLSLRTSSLGSLPAQFAIPGLAQCSFCWL